MVVLSMWEPIDSGRIKRRDYATICRYVGMCTKTIYKSPDVCSSKIFSIMLETDRHPEEIICFCYYFVSHLYLTGPLKYISKAEWIERICNNNCKTSIHFAPCVNTNCVGETWAMRTFSNRRSHTNAIVGQDAFIVTSRRRLIFFLALRSLETL